MLPHGLHHNVYVSVRLVGVQGKRVAVLQCELLSSEIADGCEYSVRRCPRWHRKDEFVHELDISRMMSNKSQLNPERPLPHWLVVYGQKHTYPSYIALRRPQDAQM